LLGAGLVDSRFGVQPSDLHHLRGDPFADSYTFQFNVIGPGKTPNFIGTVASPLKIDADGTVDLDFFKENTHCGG